MDILYYKYFMDVASGMTIFYAAEENFISQSSLSKAISRLEQELEVQLFDRSRRGMKLTVAGEYLYKELCRLAPEYRLMIQQTKGLKDQKQQLVTVCAIPSFNILNVGYVLNQYSKEHHNIFIKNVRYYDSSIAIKEINEGNIDCGIMHMPFGEQDFLYKHICMDQLFVVLPSDHVLSGKNSISLKEIENEMFIVNIWSKNIVRDIAKAWDLTLHTRTLRVNREDVLLEVAGGNGIALFYRSDLSNVNTSNVKLCAVDEIPSSPIIISVSQDAELDNDKRALYDYLYDTLMRSAE